MNVFDLYASVSLDTSNYEKNLKNARSLSSKFAGSLKRGLATAGKVAAVGIGAASTAIGFLAKIGTDYNAQMETYTTNFETMLGSQEKAVKKVAELKEFASSTPLSLDDLAKGTQTLIAFGVSSEDSTEKLRQLGDISLGNADKMQRLAVAFGKATAQGKLTGETVQAMVDAGWNPLLVISQKTGESMEELQKRMSNGKVSIEELEEAMESATSAGGQFNGGMEKASKTTEGLISTMKDNARALVGEVFMPISDNLLQTVLPGAISAIETLTTAFRERGITGMIEAAGDVVTSAVNGIIEGLPSFISTGVEIITALVTGVLQAVPSLVEAVPTIISSIVTSVQDHGSKLVSAGWNALEQIGNGIIAYVPQLVERLPEVIESFINFVNDNFPSILQKGHDFLSRFVDGITGSIPQMISKLPGVISAFVNFISSNSPKIIAAGISLIGNLAIGLIKAIPSVVAAVPKIIGALIGGFGAQIGAFVDIGKNIIQGVWNGIIGMKDWIVGKVKGFFSGIVNTVKNVLGIHSPSRVFAGIGGYMAEGVGVGWDKEFSGIKKDIQKTMSFDPVSVGVSAASFGASSNVKEYMPGSVTVNVYGRDGQSVKELANEVANVIERQRVRRSTSFA